MALGADLFLQSSSSSRPALGTGKSSDSGAAPDRAKSDSFADLYTREREAPSAADAAKPSKTTPDTAKHVAEKQPALADNGKELPAELPVELPAELPPAEVQLESLMLFERAPSMSADTAGTDAAALAAEQAVAETQLDELATLNPQLLQVATTNGRASPVQHQTEQRAPTALTDMALAEGSTEIAEGEPQVEQMTRELDASTTGRAVSAMASELRSETPTNSVNPLTQAVAQANATTAAREAATVMQQPLPMSQNGWSEAVVERVMWLSSQNLKSAEIQLDPAELGRLEVRISLNQEQTLVSFASPHAGVRDALEGQLQRLREMFNQQGMNLADVNVSDQSLARGEQNTREHNGGRGMAAGGDEHADLEEQAIASTPLNSANGLIDFYA